MCVSRSRRCEEKACYSSPQTLGGAPLFHSPCLLCVGSAGLETEAHFRTWCGRFRPTLLRWIDLIVDFQSKRRAVYLQPAIAVNVQRYWESAGGKHSHIDTAHRWGRRPAWLPHGYPEYLHWWREQVVESLALLNSDLRNSKGWRNCKKKHGLIVVIDAEMFAVSYLSSTSTFNKRNLTLYHLVIDSLFTGDDQVKPILAVLKTLRLCFNAFVAVQHVQNAVLCVSEEWGQGTKAGPRKTTDGRTVHS